MMKPMGIERENFSQEQGRENTVEVGSGELIQVTSFEKIVYQENNLGLKDADHMKEKVPVNQLKKVEETLAKLPFSIGQKESERISTFPRHAHEASVKMIPSQENQHALIFSFDKGPPSALTFEDVKKLTIEQRETQRMDSVNLIRFETDKIFELAGEEIGEIRLVVPTGNPPR